MRGANLWRNVSQVRSGLGAPDRERFWQTVPREAPLLSHRRMLLSCAMSSNADGAVFLTGDANSLRALLPGAMLMVVLPAWALWPKIAGSNLSQQDLRVNLPPRKGGMV